jgi:5-(carboxyamino)imidazole ribonucleotide synthase
VTIGVLGGGQLGRMLALAGYPLGQRFLFFDPEPDVCVDDLAPRLRAEYDDHEALARFAEGVDVVTYEFENVPVEAARRLEALGANVLPPVRALEVSQDRLLEKRFLNDRGVATAPFVVVDSEDDLRRAVERISLPAVLKTRTLGYDGKGQVVLRDLADVARAWQELGGVSLILETFVPFTRELSIIAVRGADGAIASYPLIENTHIEGILRMSFAPAQSVDRAMQDEAAAAAARLLEALDYVGVLTIELFEHEGRLLANEIAPRVHNSGHWTIEGANTSQFENHIRAVLGMPLGATAARGASVMVNLIGTVPAIERVAAVPGAHMHLYGKEPRPGRKLGHVTLCADNADDLGARMPKLMRALSGLGGFNDGDGGG